MNKKNILIMALALVLVAAISVGGTIAWLADTTQTVTNTFSPTNIDLTLTETGTSKVDGTNNDTKNFTVVPGVNLTKDPIITASSDVDYYVFVKVTPTGWTVDTATTGHTYKAFIDATSKAAEMYCQIDSSWTYLTVEDGNYIYYQTVNADNQTVTTDDFSDSVLANNTVTVLNTLTDEELQAAKDSMPQLVFAAYAIQQDGFTGTDAVNKAWAAAKAN